MVWKGFHDSRATIEIDLTKPLGELWKNLDKDARWGVDKARKEGLIVKEADKNESVEFYKIYEEMCKKEGIKQLNFNDYKAKIVDNYPVKIIVCKKDNKIISGILLTEDEPNKKIGLYINASLPEYLKFQPNNLLYWSMIEYAKNKGFKIFDLGGYKMNAKKGSKLYKVNCFKERWGGKIVEYPIYSKNLFYILGRKLVKRFPWLLRLIR